MSHKKPVILRRRPKKLRCVCGEPAQVRFGVVVQVETPRKGKTTYLTMSVPLCKGCAPKSVGDAQVLDLRGKMPLERSPIFPPGKGQWWEREGEVHIGCARCGALSSVVPSDAGHEVEPGGDLQPSFICPSCGHHDEPTLLGWRS